MFRTRWISLAAIACLMVSMPAFSVGLVEEPIATKSVDVSRYAPDPLDLRKAVLRVLINSNWTVADQTRNVIHAEYDGARLEVTINGNVVGLKELRTQERFRNAWMETIQSYLIKEMEYRRQVVIAEELMR